MHPYDVRDLFLHRQFKRVEGASSHRRLAFTISCALEDRDGYGSEAWLLEPGSGHAPRRLTPQFAAVSSLRFDARGERLALLATGGSGKQVAVLDVATCEAHPVEGLEGTPLSIEMWHPDGKRLLVTVERPFTEDAAATGGKDGGPRVVNYLPSRRDGEGWLVGRRVALVELDIEQGRQRTLVEGDFDVAEAQWSPRGDRLAYVRNESGRQRHRTGLWLADGDGGSAALATPDLVSTSGPRWSPDGRRIAFGGSEIEGDSLDHLWALDANGGSPRCVTGDRLQLEGARLSWHADGKRVATMAAHRGLIRACVVEIDSGHMHSPRLGLRTVLDVCANGDRLAFVAASMRRPCEVFGMDWDGGRRRRHTRFNRDWSDQRPLPRVAKRRFTVPDGCGGEERIEAWVLRPAEGDGPFPVLMDSHGGPQSIALVDFASHQYWYPLLSRGWMVVAPNAVGSGSYGQEFAQRLSGRWGELDLPQYLAIVDQLQSESLADERVCLTGKSYGGFLSAWALSHTERFKAVVVSAPVVNVESHAGTSDSGYYVTPYAMGGEMEDVRERYHRLSPLNCADSVRTPTLILQGDDDRRCPLGQSEELFAALIRQTDAPCRMVVYPGGSHSLASSGKPSHRLDYHQRIVDWVEQWVGPGRASSGSEQPVGNHQPERQQAPEDRAQQ